MMIFLYGMRLYIYIYIYIYISDVLAGRSQMRGGLVGGNNECII